MSKPFKSALATLNTELRNHGQVAPTELSAATHSLEGMSVRDFNTRMHSDAGSVRESIKQTMIDHLGFKPEDFSAEGYSQANEALAAGTIAYLATQNGQGASYMRAAVSNHAANATSLESLHFGPGGSMDVADANAYSQESFDNTQLANFDVQNVVLSVMAARQDSFAEAWFPTKTVTAAEGGLQITVDVQELVNDAKHPLTGKPLPSNRARLSDAFHNAELLNNPATDLVPWVNADTESNFVSDALFETREVPLNNKTVPTRPLLVDREINWLGISQNPASTAGGQFDLTDQIAPGARIKALYMSLANADGEQLIKLNVQSLAQNQFRKAHEGQGRAVQLNLVVKNFPITESATDIAGVAIPESLRSALAGNIAYLKFTVTGNGNYDTGDFNILPSSIQVSRIVTADDEKTEIAVDGTRGTQIVEAFKALGAKIVCFDPDARLSNSNWRNRGTIVDVTPYTEMYAIEPGYPITVLSATSEEASAAKVQGMVNAARIRNSINAVTTLLNYADQLNAYKEAFNAGFYDMDIVGAGKRNIVPFYERHTIDIQKALVNEKSSERSSDVSSVLVDYMRDAIYRAHQESNYGPVLDLATGGAQAKACVLIGCDNIIQRHLDIVADRRLLGEYLDYEVVSTNDSRMRGKIFVSFTRKQPGSEDCLGFGTHAYVPELIHRVNASQNGATVTNDRVIPRSIHVPVLPILIEFDVLNLTEATINAEA